MPKFVELSGNAEAELTENGVLFKQRPEEGWWKHFFVKWDDFEKVLENSYYDETSRKQH